MTLYCRQPPGGDLQILVFWSCHVVCGLNSQICVLFVSPLCYSNTQKMCTYMSGKQTGLKVKSYEICHAD